MVLYQVVPGHDSNEVVDQGPPLARLSQLKRKSSITIVALLFTGILAIMIYSISKPTASLLGLLTTSLSITTSNAASDCSPPLAPSSSSASSSEIVSSFYPPGINSTSYITNFTSDSLGGIDAYTAPTRGPTAGTPYGVYDYCSMPHLRKEQYQIPAAVQGNGTQSKGRLVYLEYLQRHQRRTAYNILPGGEVRSHIITLKDYKHQY